MPIDRSEQIRLRLAGLSTLLHRRPLRRFALLENNQNSTRFFSFNWHASTINFVSVYRFESAPHSIAAGYELESLVTLMLKWVSEEYTWYGRNVLDASSHVYRVRCVARFGRRARTDRHTIAMFRRKRRRTRSTSPTSTRTSGRWPRPFATVPKSSRRRCA